MFSPTLPSWPYENQLVSATSFSQISSSRASLWASAQVRNRSCPMDKNMVLEARMVGTWCHQKLMFDDFSWRFLHGLKAKTSYSWKFMPSRLPASQTFRGLSQPISHRGLSIASHDEPSRLAVLTCGKKPWVVVGSGYWTSGWYTVYRYIYIYIYMLAHVCMYTCVCIWFVCIYISDNHMVKENKENHSDNNLYIKGFIYLFIMCNMSTHFLNTRN